MQQCQFDLVGNVLHPLLQWGNQQFEQHKFGSYRPDMPLSDGFQYAVSSLTVGG